MKTLVPQRIDLEAAHPGYDERSRRETRPALTTIILILLAITVFVDVLRRRRQPAAPETLSQPKTA
jgi:hypothetical protein